jgi:hypothetical protein
MLLFSEVQALTAKKVATDVPTNSLKRYSKLDHHLLQEAFSSGGVINIFDLLETLSKKCTTSDGNLVVRRVIENLKPG